MYEPGKKLSFSRNGIWCAFYSFFSNLIKKKCKFIYYFYLRHFQNGMLSTVVAVALHTLKTQAKKKKELRSSGDDGIKMQRFLCVSG